MKQECMKMATVKDKIEFAEISKLTNKTRQGGMQNYTRAIEKVGAACLYLKVGESQQSSTYAAR